jgi:hypothetical protein
MAGRPKGLPKTGGRQRGTPNKKDVIMRERIAAARMTPLEFMLSVMDNDNQPMNLRADMAKAAAPYVHARPTEKPQSEAGHLPIVIGEISDADRIKALEALISGRKPLPGTT